MTARSILAFSALTAFSYASPEKSGHATAEWLSEKAQIEGNKPIKTAIRMVIEDGWHSYWVNPGDSGANLKVVWELPEGWTVSELSYPAPKKFLTGDLPSYGYEGEVIFPVTIIPPTGVTGPVELGAKVSWLTCNDASCIPGKVELKLSPASGDEKQAAQIIEAEKKVPKLLENAELQVTEHPDSVTLSLDISKNSAFDPTDWEVFPVTEQALDHRQPIKFQKDGANWTAKTTRNQYAEGALKELSLVLSKQGEAPVELRWSAK